MPIDIEDIPSLSGSFDETVEAFLLSDQSTPSGTGYRTLSDLLTNGDWSDLISTRDEVTEVDGTDYFLMLDSADGLLKRISGADLVDVLGGAGGADTEIQFNSSGSLAGSSDLTWDGATLSTLAIEGTTGTFSGGVTVSSGNLTVTSGINYTGNVSGDNNSDTLIFTSGGAVEANIEMYGTGSGLDGYIYYDADLHTLRTANGGTTLAIFQNSGITLSKDATVAPTTASTSTTTGALIVGGGVGVAGAVWAGGNITLTTGSGDSPYLQFYSGGGYRHQIKTVDGAGGYLSFVSVDGTGYRFDTTVTMAGALDVTGAVTSSSVFRSGSAGSGTGGNYRTFNDAGTLQWTFGILGTVGATNWELFNNVAGASRVTVTTAGVVTVTATTASTSTTTGSFVNAGGFGNAGAAYFGGLLSVSPSGAQGRIVVGANNAGSYSSIDLNGNGSQTNWRIGSNITLGNAFEIIPSTATGGTTFTTPVATFSPTAIALNQTVTCSSTLTAAGITASGSTNIATTNGYVAATSTATTGQPTMFTATASGGENVGWKYVEVATGTTVVDVWQFRIGGVVGRDTVFTHYDTGNILTIGTGSSTGGVTVHNGLTCENLTMTAVGTGTATFSVIDNNASAFLVRQSTNEYIKVVTTNGSEKVDLGNTSTLPQIRVLTTTASTSSTTGALVCAGGFGLAGDMYVTGTFDLVNASSGGAINLTITGANATVTVMGPSSDPVLRCFASEIRYFKPMLGYDAGATLGWATGFGAGGVVTQATSKSTGVTLNKNTGQITTHNESVTNGDYRTFTFTNNKISAEDIVVLTLASGADPTSHYDIFVQSVGAGSCVIKIINRTGSTVGEALVINFCVIQGAAT